MQSLDHVLGSHLSVILAFGQVTQGDRGFPAVLLLDASGEVVDDVDTVTDEGIRIAIDEQF